MAESEAPTSSLTLAYLLLAHEGAEQIKELVRLFLDADPTAHVVVHYDLNSPDAEYAALEQAFALEDRALLVKDRARCGWGLFGLVDGVVRALRELRDHDIRCDYVFLLSGSCMPIKPLALLKRFLAENRGMEFIEAHPPEWIVDGLREERYRYRHWFSFRTHRNLFELSWRIQRMLGLKRRLPKRLAPRFGPQWWCLTQETCFAILKFIDRYPGSYRFFKTTWIPDELFFQTMAASIATPGRIYEKSLTFFKFTPRGRPITFYDDQIDLVAGLPGFFARKISPSAHTLRRRLAEIAAAPDDDQPFPVLQSRSDVLDYERRLRGRQIERRPGQLYFADQTFTGWPSSLAQSKRPFVVLHGPPAVTRVVREHLRGILGVTLLGRVFCPEAVQLEPLGEAYEGFTPEDAAIRDLDPPLYLSRLLERAEGLPVIEISPGDAPHGEGYFLFSDKVVFVSCQPDDPTDEASRRMYWLLTAAANRASVGDPLLASTDRISRQDVPQRADALIERYTPGPHRTWLTGMLLTPEPQQPFVRLSWGAGKRRLPSEALATRLGLLQETYGDEFAPLARALAGLDAKLATLRPSEITGDLAADWRDYFTRGAGKSYFSGGAGETFEDWAALFDRSSAGYAVLHGPPAMTRIVREHLREASGVTLLGRVFAPQPDMAGGEDSGLTAADLELRERDRPLFLSRLLARADGFPVIEVVPGDDPVGESYFFEDENSLFIACQPDQSSDDDRRRLYWALTAAAAPGSAQDLANHGPHASLQRVRAQIDAFIEKFTAREHRKRITEPLLLGDSQASGFLRLRSGSGRRVADSEPLARSLSRLRRTLGPAFAPLLNGLRAIDATLAAITTADLTAGLPTEWRDYFLVGEEPTFESWAAAFGQSSQLYGVLYGPPSATRTVASHLREASDIALLGRIYEPRSTAGHAAARERVEDRPSALLRQLSETEGFPVIEVCPGDERHGEEFFLWDTNAVILSCEPADPDDEAQRELYWALATSANPVAARDLLSGKPTDQSDGAIRHRLLATIEKYLLKPHRDWLTETVLHADDADRVVRLPWATAGEYGRWRDVEEPLRDRLARLKNVMGGDIAPLVQALEGVDAKLAQISRDDLALELPFEWQRLFVKDFDLDEQVA